MSENDMKRLMALMQRALHGGYLDLTDWVRDQNALTAIEERIIAGNIDNAIIGTDDAAAKLATDIHDSYVAAGKQSAEWLNAKIDDALIHFNQNAPTVVAQARANQLELVQGFQEERNAIARQIAQRAMIEGAQGGINPRRVAQDFRDSIGLTPTQEGHVANYRRQLENGDYSGALSRELTDGRYDRAVRSARDNGTAPSPAHIDKYVDAYRSNYIDHRAETIARTESLKNANKGAVDAIQQAIDRGDVEAGVLIKTWHAGPKTKDARATHQLMNGVTAKWGEDFAVPSRFGPVLMSQPGDPRGGAENCVGCRCAMSTSFNLDQLAKALVRKGYLRARIDRVLRLVA